MFYEVIGDVVYAMGDELFLWVLTENVCCDKKWIFFSFCFDLGFLD